MMNILDLPQEIILLIAQSLPSAADITVLLRVNQTLHNLVRDEVYKRDIKDTGGLSLTFYAFWGYEQPIHHMLRLGADVNIQNKRWRDYTPLEVAISRAELPVVRTLIEYGALKRNSARALSLALLNKCEDEHCREDLTLIELLLDSDVDPNSWDSGDGSHTFAALSPYDLAKLKILICYGADVRRFGNLADIISNLETHQAMSTAQIISIFKLLLDSNGFDLNSHGTEGTSALHEAVKSNPNLVPLLLENGADVHIQSSDRSGRKTALHYATTNWGATYAESDSIRENTCLDTIKLLLNHGADVNSRDSTGRRPLHCVRGDRPAYREVADVLLSHGADINARDANGWTILHSMLPTRTDDRQQKTEPQVEALIDAVKWASEHGIDLNVTNNTGETAIFHLIDPRFVDHDQPLQTIVKLGADVNAKNAKSCTPLLRAASFGLDKAVKILLENGADVHHRDNDGLTALHWAARTKARSQKPTNILNCLGLLLEYGADVNTRSPAGTTPLTLALENFCPPREELLRNAEAIE